MATMDPTGRLRELNAALAQATGDRERLDILIEFRGLADVLSSAELNALMQEAVATARRIGAYDEMGRCGAVLAETALRASGDPAAVAACIGYVDEAAKASGSLAHEGRSHYLWGEFYQARGEYDKAREAYERCLTKWRADGYTSGVAAALSRLGGLLGLQGNPAGALEYYQECLRIDDELGDEQARARHQYSAGWALQRLGRWEDAVESFYRIVAISERTRTPALRNHALNALGELFLERDKVPRAIDTFQMVVEAGRRQEALPEMYREALGNLGLAFHRQGDLARAATAYREALELTELSGDRREQAILLCRMAELALDQGQLDQAWKTAELALSQTQKLGLRCEEGEARRVEGLVLAAQGDNVRARASFGLSLELLQDLEEGYDLARARLHFGRLLLSEGEGEQARPHLKTAARVFRKLGVVAEADDANRLLFRLDLQGDSDMALLQGISGLTTLGVEPDAFLERAIGLVGEALGYGSAVVTAGGRAILVVGRPDVRSALDPDRRTRVMSSPSSLSWPVRFGGDVLGTIYLERVAPQAGEHNHLVLETIANLLASPIHRLAELSVSAAEELPGLTGLRYRGLVGRDARMVETLATVCAVAGKGVPVLIRGESGTGKGLVARALHESGDRAGKPFVAVSCAGVPESLLEGELFGVEEGAATGVAVHKGEFERANGGTVFLDDIGDMSPALQMKLLRVLQERRFERVGGRVSIEVDVRAVTATDQAIGELVEQRKFSEELYSRLTTVELVLPPLRERRGDIPDLVRYFVRRSNQEFGRDVVDVSPEAMSRLVKQDWPGNVRELERVVERSVLLARGSTVQIDDLPPSLQAQPSTGRGPLS